MYYVTVYFNKTFPLCLEQKKTFLNSDKVFISPAVLCILISFLITVTVNAYEFLL